MLLQLSIRDLAVVEHAELDFQTGMTVITGETGAGKSILLDALQLVLGGRGDSNMIRPECEKCDISALFDVSHLPGAVLWLSECDLSEEEPNLCIVRRVIHRNGRSKAFINGHMATKQQLRALGQFLVQIHGQHQHQTLTQSPEQCRLLDAFGQHGAYCDKTLKAYEEWDKLCQTKQRLLGNQHDQARLELLRYQFEELERFSLEKHTIPELIAEHDTLANAQGTIHSTSAALDLLRNDDNCPENIIGEILHLLKNSQATEIKNVEQCLEQAKVNLQEAKEELRCYIDSLDTDPERVHDLSNLLGRLQDIARKHRVEVENLYPFQQQLHSDITEMERLSTTLESIDEDITLARQHYLKQARQLTKARTKTAKVLGDAVTKTLQNLGLSGAIFAVTIKPYDDERCHPHGQESIHFEFSANPGHPLQNLAKVASGGELSRVSLALQLVAQQYLATPTLIFDEVDVGIGGKVGALVGKALHELAKTAQVLCITHLPQVAAKGGAHLLVQKRSSKAYTQSNIRTLSEAERIEELARMLGGENVTLEARKNAEALLTD